MKNKIIACAVLLTTNTVASIEIDDQTLAQAQKNSQTIDIAHALKSPKNIQQILNQQHSLADKVLTSAALLKALKIKEPTAEQKSWVEKLTQSDDVLHIENPDHPNQLIEVVNIARQAKNTKMQWQINNQAVAMKEQWLNQDWQWQSFIERASQLDYLTLGKALKNIDINTINWLQTELKQQDIDNISPQLIALLIDRKMDTSLIEHLWQLPNDQYSYQVLQLLPERLASEQAIAQIIKASENSALTSQALVLLAKHYSDQEITQNYLLEQLIDEQNKWHAASAITYVQNDQFQQRIFKLRQESPSPAINFASKLIMQESQQ